MRNPDGVNFIKRSCARGYTLVEIMTVIVILGIGAAVSYPSLSSSYARNRLNSACFEIAGALKTARGLSVTSSDNRVYGVRFKPDGEYCIYSLPDETLITAASFDDAIIATQYDLKHALDPSVAITNFITAPVPFFIVFRDDGVPTADGVSIPLPDEAAVIKLESLAVKAEMTVKISKSSGLAEVR